MPRDLGLEGKEKENEKSVPLTESPNSTEFEINSSEEQQDGRFILQRRTLQDRANTSQNLHPYTRPLTISDLESCIALEDAAFPENERCSREKVSSECLFFFKLSVTSCHSFMPLRTIRCQHQDIFPQNHDSLASALWLHLSMSMTPENSSFIAKMFP